MLVLQVDLAAEFGGNCEVTRPNEVFNYDSGVTIIGLTDLPSRMATQSSMLYANNLTKFIMSAKPEDQTANSFGVDLVRENRIAGLTILFF